MQARKNNNLPCRRPLIAAIAALVSCSAWAEDPSPWYIGASQSFTHDSNVYRVPNSTPDPDGKSHGDNYSSSGLLGGFDQPIGRQRLYGTANVRYNKYQDHNNLNNTSYGMNAGWDWETIEKLSGSLNASANQSLATFDGNATQPTTVRNLVKTDQVSASVRWGGAARLSVSGDYAHSRVSYSAATSQSSDSSADTGSIGTSYVVSPDLRVGAAVRLTRTVAPNGTQVTPTTFESTTSNGRNLDLTGDWQSTAQTGVNARLSWTRQTDSGAAGRDFSGLTGALSARYAPTAKLRFNASYSRDAGTNGSFFNVVAAQGSSPTTGLYENSQVSDGLNLGASYAATAKIDVTAGYQYRKAKIVSNISAGGGSAQTGDYTDTLRIATLGASWAIARAWSLSCSLSHENRDVGSVTAYAYSANVAACSAQFTLR